MQDHQKESKGGHQEIQQRDHTRNGCDIKEPEEKVRRTQKIGRDRLITFLDKQCREIHEQDRIVERIEEFYTGLYDSEQSTIIYTDPKDVPALTSWEMEKALGDMKNGAHRNIEKQGKLLSRRHLLSCTLNAYQKDVEER